MFEEAEEGAVHEVDTEREEKGASIRRSDRKVRVVGQVNDIRVYSYRGKARKRAYWCIRRAHLSGEGSSRACRSALVRLTLNTSFTAW